MAYGIPYKGSKNFIAKKIIDTLPPADVFVDLFAGGCAITHAAIKSRKYKKIICNDINNYNHIFYNAINGAYPWPPKWISREDFENSTDELIKYCWSFDNKGSAYLYGKHIEPWKKALHFARFGDDTYIKKMGIDLPCYDNKTIKENEKKIIPIYQEWYKKKYNLNWADLNAELKKRDEIFKNVRAYMREVLNSSGIKVSSIEKHTNTQMGSHWFGKCQPALPTLEMYQKIREVLPLDDNKMQKLGYYEYLQDFQLLERLQRLQRLQHLQHLERLQRLQHLQHLQHLQTFKNLKITNLDYRSVKIPANSLIYCDPPYIGTDGYNNEDFNHDEFYNWIINNKNLVVISEYTQPPHTVCVWSQKKRVTLGSNKTVKVEKLFVNNKKKWDDLILQPSLF